MYPVQHATNKASALLKLKIALHAYQSHKPIANDNDSSQESPTIHDATQAIVELVKLPSVDFATSISAVRLATQSRLRTVARAGVDAIIQRYLGQASYIEEARILQFEIQTQAAHQDVSLIQDSSAEAVMIFDSILSEHNSGVCRLKSESIKKIHYFAWNMACAFARDLNDHSQGYQWFKRILAILPRDEVAAQAQCLRMAAFCAKQLGDWDAVVDCASKSHQLEPLIPFPLMLMFLGHLHKGNSSDGTMFKLLIPPINFLTNV